MLQLFERIVDPVASACSYNCFDIHEKSFYLTGEFEFGDCSRMKSILCRKGNIPVSSVTKKTDFLIAGSNDSKA